MPTTICLRSVLLGCASALLLASSFEAYAQSGSRTTTPPRVQTQPASRQRAPASAQREDETPVALDGYCPVCLVEMKQWVKGNSRTSVEFDGQEYLFPAAEQAEMFQANPAKFTPVLSGDDVVHYAQTGERVAGSLQFGALYEGRNYFFASAENKEKFRTNPSAFEDADLAISGECVVCRVAMNKRVAGSAELTVLHDGLRYQFPGEDQQAAFMKAPTSYVEKLSSQPNTTGGSRSGNSQRRQPVGSGSR